MLGQPTLLPVIVQDIGQSNLHKYDMCKELQPVLLYFELINFYSLVPIFPALCRHLIFSCNALFLMTDLKKSSFIWYKPVYPSIYL